MALRVPRATRVQRLKNGDYAITVTVSRFKVPRLLHVIEPIQGPGDETLETEETYLGEALKEAT